jgi:hypothetical protein
MQRRSNPRLPRRRLDQGQDGFLDLAAARDLPMADCRGHRLQALELFEAFNRDPHASSDLRGSPKFPLCEELEDLRAATTEDGSGFLDGDGRRWRSGEPGVELP